MLAMVSFSRACLRGGMAVRMLNSAGNGGFRRCLATEVRTAVERAETQVRTTRRGITCTTVGLSICTMQGY